MRPVLYSWRGRAVPSYAAMLYLSSVLALLAGNLAANAIGLNPARVYVISVVLLPVGILGARVASVLGAWSAYRQEPVRALRRSEGGLAMYGGLVTVPVSVPVLAALGLPFWAYWDVATFSLLTGMVFARAGCLLNGCCAGRPTHGRFAIKVTDRSGIAIRRIPTQLLEAGVALLLLAGATVFAGTDPPPGSVLIGSLAVYSLARLLLQPLRELQTQVAGIPVLMAASGWLLVTTATLMISRLS